MRNKIAVDGPRNARFSICSRSLTHSGLQSTEYHIPMPRTCSIRPGDALWSSKNFIVSIKITQRTSSAYNILLVTDMGTFLQRHWCLRNTGQPTYPENTPGNVIHGRQNDACGYLRFLSVTALTRVLKDSNKTWDLRLKTKFESIFTLMNIVSPLHPNRYYTAWSSSVLTSALICWPPHSSAVLQFHLQVKPDCWKGSEFCNCTPGCCPTSPQAGIPSKEEK